MGKSTTASSNFLKILYTAVAWANIADNASSSPTTNIYAALHTADPGAGGTQATSEAAYTSYARQAVARTTGGFTVTSNSVSPVANIDFPAATGSPSETETYFSFGKTVSGSTDIFHSGTVTPNIAVTSAGVIPRLTTATAVTEA